MEEEIREVEVAIEEAGRRVSTYSWHDSKLKGKASQHIRRAKGGLKRESLGQIETYLNAVDSLIHEDSYAKAKAGIRKEKKRVVDRDWFNRSRQTEVEHQLQFAEEALRIGLPGRAEYHLRRIPYIIEGDTNARTNHQEQLARQEAKRKQIQLVAELKATGISATPFTAQYQQASIYWIDWGIRGLLRFVPRIGRRFSRSATHHSLDGRFYPAGERLLAAVTELREKMRLPDDRLHIFEPKPVYGGARDPILAIRVDDTDEYVCIAHW